MDGSHKSVSDNRRHLQRHACQAGKQRGLLEKFDRPFRYHITLIFAKYSHFGEEVLQCLKRRVGIHCHYDGLRPAPFSIIGASSKQLPPQALAPMISGAFLAMEFRKIRNILGCLICCLHKMLWMGAASNIYVCVVFTKAFATGTTLMKTPRRKRRPMQRGPLTKMLVNVPDDLRAWLRDQAARSNMSMTSLIVAAVRERMERTA
ncbi:hypothetical protein [Bradyrhizobium sp. HKCCYLRH3061]|uniref:hypothetical protein n=1 Tax=Bradyrhizobium sp. HKCCYLRH3061 TaxID=3420734 RepID=UPI003EBFB9EE